MIGHAVWDQPQLAAQVVQPRHDGCNDMLLRVEPLHDARQILRLEQRLLSLPGVRRVTIERDAQRVRVIWDGRKLSLPALLDAFAAAGVPARPLRRETIDDTNAVELRDALKRLLVAGMCAMQVMAYAFVIYIGVVDFVDFSTRGLFRWLGLITTLPLVFYSARTFFTGAAQELREHRLGIQSPVALAIALVFAASTWNTLRGQGEIYFDSVSMFIFLLLGARYLELRARHRSDAQGDAVIDATPMLARRRKPDGSLETVATTELRAGDLLHIGEGELVPADGVLNSAQVSVDEALLSGESRPVLHRRGERLVAGSVLIDGPAELRVELAGAQTAAARLAALASGARLARKVAAGSDRDVVRFVTRVLLLTLATALGWLLVDPSRAFDAAISVLVVACPCAYALIQPLASTRAISLLARHGVLVTNADALTVLARVDLALFDKTGTLGTAQFDAAAIEPLRGHDRSQLLAWAAALASESSHPLARALAQMARKQLPSWPHAQAVSVIAGAGIEGTVEGRRLRLGRTEFALAASDRANCSTRDDSLLLADADGPLANFPLDEQPRSEARGMLDRLRADGITTSIASGDSSDRVARLAARLDTQDWQARQSADDKLRGLNARRVAGQVVLAVGDGSNDAPLLAGADVSAALDSGTGLAQSHADLLLLDGRLNGLLHARAVARKLQLVVTQGRRWSLGYNLAVVPFAAFGFIPPWLAGIGMSLSSLLMVLDAMRINHGDIEPPETSGASA